MSKFFEPTFLTLVLLPYILPSVSFPLNFSTFVFWISIRTSKIIRLSITVSTFSLILKPLSSSYLVSPSTVLVFICSTGTYFTKEQVLWPSFSFSTYLCAWDNLQFMNSPLISRRSTLSVFLFPSYLFMSWLGLTFGVCNIPVIIHTTKTL